MRKGNRAFLLLSIAFAWKWQIASLPKDIHKKKKLRDGMIKQLLNSEIADQLFASAFGHRTNHDILLNLVQ